MSQCDENEPGHPAPNDGNYEALNVFGTPIGMTKTVRKGEPFPDLPYGYKWRRITVATC